MFIPKLALVFLCFLLMLLYVYTNICYIKPRTYMRMCSVYYFIYVNYSMKKYPSYFLFLVLKKVIYLYGTANVGDM